MPNLTASDAEFAEFAEFAERLAKRHVTYHPAPKKRCGNCKYYTEFGSECSNAVHCPGYGWVVKNVSPHGVCDLWTEKPQ